ncbi:MAG: outer membrane beta-barrel protein [Bacteroidota bacterium]|nr:outer membrane beta-barrel protein [Bacteroidota bacterium]MDP4211085.1 outer membrane beta-barrel protein [Bacteroidota bacterium]MDP4249180.1 outer membrane beta-barrel protein [Bacteroidota bacterium]
MEYLDDEMDDLFRKAGEQYPLKTSDSDWDAVLGRLQPTAGGESSYLPENGKKRNNKRRFFWLLFLLPLGLFSLKYFQGTPGNGKIRSTDQATGNSSLKSETTQAGKMESARLHTNPVQPAHAQSNPPNPSSDVPALILSSGINVRSPVIRLSKKATAADQKTSINADLNSKSGIADNSYETSKTGPDTKPTPDIPKPAGDQPGSATASSKNGVAQTTTQDAGNPGDVVKTEKAKQLPVTAENTGSVNGNKKDEKKAKVSPGKERGIYLSLLAGPDFSTVKFQSVKNTGYSVGIRAGYRFNKHISLETGIGWDKKQYYSDGKYFNKSKTDIPASYNIQDLTGNCIMFEIPVSLRYDFSYNPRGRFFSTVGLSSYLMKKENYSYEEEYGGSAWSHDVSYKNSGNNIFSILQLSAGYEYNCEKIGRIRIEPYLRIPLTGVGIGQLPISSAGLQLGITHSFR